MANGAGRPPAMDTLLTNLLAEGMSVEDALQHPSIRAKISTAQEKVADVRMSKAVLDELRDLPAWVEVCDYFAEKCEPGIVHKDGVRISVVVKPSGKDGVAAVPAVSVIPHKIHSRKRNAEESDNGDEE